MLRELLSENIKVICETYNKRSEELHGFQFELSIKTFELKQ